MGLKTLGGLKTPLPLGFELSVGRLEGGCPEGRREKGMRDSKAPAPASLLLEGPEGLRLLLAGSVMPRKSVLNVRCGVLNCGDAGRLSGLRNEPPGMPSSQERGRSGTSRS